MMTVESVKNIHVFKMVVFSSGIVDMKGHKFTLLYVNCEQSHFCSKISGEERKKLSEHDIRGVGYTGARDTHGSPLEYHACSVFCVLPRRILSKRGTAHSLTLLNLFL